VDKTRDNMLVVFDCDGTLADSQAAIVTAMTNSFRELGFAPPKARQVRAVVGLSLPQAISTLTQDLPEIYNSDQIAMLVERYKLHYQNLRALEQSLEPLFDGIADLIQDLSKRGIPMAVATGKSERGLNRCLEQNGLTNVFVSLQTADRHPSKPHPAMLLQAIADTGAKPDKTWVLGDTRYDMEMAQAASAKPVGVSWGYHSRKELIKSGALCVLDHPCDFLPLIDRDA